VVVEEGGTYEARCDETNSRATASTDETDLKMEFAQRADL
jgi:hypothetical protein